MSVEENRAEALEFISKYSKKLAVSRVAQAVAADECARFQSMIDRSMVNLTQSIREGESVAEKIND